MPACAKRFFEECVNLSQPREGFKVMVFLDASDFCWGAMVTHVPNGDLRAGLDASDTKHAPFGFVSGAFTKSKLQRPTVDKEAFATVETFKCLEWLPWEGLAICTDHRNMVWYIFPTRTRWYRS